MISSSLFRSRDEDIKNDDLKKIPGRVFELFVDAKYLYAFCNMYYTSQSSLLKRRKKVRGENFKSSVEPRGESTFDQSYPAFLVGHSTKEMVVRTLPPRLSTLEECYQAETFGTLHELERELNNTRTPIPAEICLELLGKMQILARILLESPYDFLRMLLIHTDAEIRILL